MATFYSSFFSSGLLAPLPHERGPSPSSPSTPRQSHSLLPGSDPFFVDPDTTPTAIEFSASRNKSIKDEDVLPTAPSAHSHSDSSSSSSSGSINVNGDRPRLRRRRSSLTASTSPVAAMKSAAPPRAARQSLFVSRARSGSEASSYARMSVSGESATERNSLVGRMRSGSVGGAVIRARRISRKPAPPLPAPPPTAPLPAPPSHSASLPFPIPSITTTQPSTPPRRPLARRAHTTDNTLPPSALLMPASMFSPSSSPFASPMYMTPDEEMEDMMSMGIPSSPGYEPAMERCGGKLGSGMQVDYPSPVEGPDKGFAWGRENMKEN